MKRVTKKAPKKIAKKSVTKQYSSGDIINLLNTIRGEIKENYESLAISTAKQFIQITERLDLQDESAKIFRSEVRSNFEDIRKKDEMQNENIRGNSYLTKEIDTLSERISVIENK